MAQLERRRNHLRSCDVTDAATLSRWFGEDATAWCGVRVMDEFTMWPFITVFRGERAGYLQAWRTTGGVAGLEIFIAPDRRRRGLGARALRLLARHLRAALGWDKITIEPHSDDEPAIACYQKAGFYDAGERRDDGDHTHVILEWP